MASNLSKLRQRGGRLLVAGLGGSFANAIHMAADLRKLCDIDAECFDNMAELTARANDIGWDDIFIDWILKGSSKDGLMVLSVGGGDEVKKISVPLIRAFDAARGKGMMTFAIVGYGSNQRGGYIGHNSEIVVRIPVLDPKRVTPHSEAFQAVIWHCLVSHPALQKHPTTW